LFESKYNSANPQSCIQIVTRDALEGKKSGNAFLREVIRKHMPDIHLAAPEDAIVRSDDYSVIGVILNSYDRDTIKIKNGLLTTADLMNQLNGMHDPEFSHTSTYDDVDYIAGDADSGYYAWLNILFQ